MSRLRILRSALSAIALSLVFVVPAWSDSEGHAWNVESSPLAVERVYSNSALSPGSTVFYAKDCMDVKNLGVRKATFFRGLFGLISDDGRSVKKPLDLIADEPLEPAVSKRFCVNWGYNDTPNERLTGFLVFQRFSDGSSWFLSPPYPGAILSDSHSPLTITRAEAYLPSFQCVAVKNASDRVIVGAQIAFPHFDSSGRLLDEDVLDLALHLAPGETLSGNCRVIDIQARPDVFYYAAHGAKGNIKVPQILYRGGTLSLGAFVRRVDFDDHSSWRDR